MGRKYGEKIVSQFGWAVFLADYYGEGQVFETGEEAGKAAGVLFEDREELRLRARGAFDAVHQLQEVDKSKIGAIGFCFGGLAAIELFKMGLNLQGVAAFHVTLSEKMGNHEGKKLPIAKGIKSPLLVMQGYLDPLAKAQDRDNFEKEMHEAGIDWQLHLFGKASHAFTNPYSNDAKGGLIYDKTADERSFKMMGQFFTGLFL